MKKLLLVTILIALLLGLVGCTQSQKTLKEQQITNNELINELEQKLGADFVLERKGNIIEIISLKQEGYSCFLLVPICLNFLFIFSLLTVIQIVWYSIVKINKQEEINNV